MLIQIRRGAGSGTHPHLLEVGREVLTLGYHGHVVVLPLLLGQQLEPALHWALDYLTAGPNR